MNSQVPAALFEKDGPDDESVRQHDRNGVIAPTADRFLRNRHLRISEESAYNFHGPNSVQNLYVTAQL